MTDPVSTTMEEQLVAYLDGELDDRATELVERRLSEDAIWRGALQKLQQAWDCLDELPLSEADDTFARTTIEMVVQQAESEQQRAKSRWLQGRRGRWFRSGLGFIGALSAGFLLARGLWPNPDRDFLRELPLIVHVEPLTRVQDIRLLELLDQEGLFSGTEIRALEGPAELAPAAFLANAPRTRRDYVAKLSPAAKLRLSEQQQSFHNLSKVEQQQIRQVYAALSQRPDGERLFNVMIRFDRWLAELPVSEQVGLSALATEDQVDRIRELQARDQLDFHQMPTSDQDAIRVWLANMLQQRLKALLAAGGSGRSTAHLRRRWAELADRSPQEQIPHLRAIVWIRGGLKQHPITRNEVASVVRELSPDVRSAVEAHLAANDSEQAMAELLRKWVISAAGFRRPRPAEAVRPPQRQEPDLEKFFATQLSTAQRVDLLQMPLTEMKQELRRLYDEQQPTERPPPPPRSERQPPSQR